MKIFTCGPVALYPQVQSVRQQEIVYFRTPEYSQIVRESMEGLQRCLKRRDQNRMLYLACSGSGAMEAAIENCMNLHDRALVIQGGGFGKRFAHLLYMHNHCYDCLELKWNESLTPKHLEAYEGRGFTRLFVNLDETTTGQLYDLSLLKDFCKRNSMKLIVDAISSFLVDDNDYTDVDMVIFSSQKGLCCSPGCSFISLSEDLAQQIENGTCGQQETCYFDLRDYLKNMERAQTPYTPAVMVMYEVREMLKIIEESGGVDAWIEHIASKASFFRQEACRRGYAIPAYPKSNMLTPILFKAPIDATKFARVLFEKGFAVCPCGGDMAPYLIRVGHAGNITIEDHSLLLDAMDEVRTNLQEDLL